MCGFASPQSSISSLFACLPVLVLVLLPDKCFLTLCAENETMVLKYCSVVEWNSSLKAQLLLSASLARKVYDPEGTAASASFLRLPTCQILSCLSSSLRTGPCHGSWKTMGSRSPRPSALPSAWLSSWEIRWSRTRASAAAISSPENLRALLSLRGEDSWPTGAC